MGIHTVTLEQLLAQASAVHHSLALGDVEAAWHSMQQFETMAGLFRLQEPAPIDMLIFCPRCGLQHIDAPEPYSREANGAAQDGSRPYHRWTNPPHRSHLCERCLHVWRHCDFPTNGVASIKTQGKNDSVSVEPIRSPIRLDTAAYNQAIDDVLEHIAQYGGADMCSDIECALKNMRRKA